jgi:hypothetical protein
MKKNIHRINKPKSYNSQYRKPQNLYNSDPDDEDDDREIYDDEHNTTDNPADFDEDYEEEYRLIVTNRDEFNENGYEGFYN